MSSGWEFSVRYVESKVSNPFLFGLSARVIDTIVRQSLGSNWEVPGIALGTIQVYVLPWVRLCNWINWI